MESLLAACSATCRTGGGLAATRPLDLARVLDLEEDMKQVVSRNQEAKQEVKQEVEEDEVWKRFQGLCLNSGSTSKHSCCCC